MTKLEYSLTKLERIYKELKEIVKYEDGLHMMNQTLHQSFIDKITEEILPAIEGIIYYKPDDDYGEPGFTSNEMHSSAWNQHQELHR